MAWRLFKQRPSITEANRASEVARETAEIGLAQVKKQQPQVDSIVDKLSKRRESNNFGDEVTITFRPRKA